MQQFLQFIYSSTCFGRPHAYHQELNKCNSNLWFYIRSLVIVVLLVVVGLSPVYYLDIYLQLNMLQASSRLSSEAQQLQ
jgi:hypothetical protein